MALLRRTWAQAMARSLRPLLRAVVTNGWPSVSATERRTRRMSRPMLKALTVIVGRIRCCQVPEPEAGSTRRRPRRPGSGSRRARTTASRCPAAQPTWSERRRASAPLAARRQDAQRHADEHREQHAGAGQQHRVRQAAEHQRQRRRSDSGTTRPGRPVAAFCRKSRYWTATG